MGLTQTQPLSKMNILKMVKTKENEKLYTHFNITNSIYKC
ncbi:hypothetical protein Belba_2970 [Belliella baltica DSM 15883]|uniref:Uncharacterized protein n=1 Tax=Belliella baltica (strain DSM 15883 / CIP 108006 / LMG 21964 / BA134) TaxID=866536 RepID=I3Z8C7_BELBD|nr:hypothetical protein Belba_2970 [Belliella baltica DSM 15883]